MIKIARTNVALSDTPLIDGKPCELKFEGVIHTDESVELGDIAARAWHALDSEFTGSRPRVERIIANGPATVVFWDDGEKTVVKCRECVHGSRNCGGCGSVSPYDFEKAVMAAMLKRLAPGWQDDVRKAEMEVQ